MYNEAGETANQMLNENELFHYFLQKKNTDNQHVSLREQ
jgi:hypothetical protein